MVKGMHLESFEEIQKAVMVLRDIPIEAPQNCYDAWKNCWYRCVDVQGTISKGIKWLFNNF